MAFISLDNNNFYRPPLRPPPARSRKPSKSPVPPEWTTSFPSQIASTAYSSSPVDAPVLQQSASKPSEPSAEESLAINSSIALVEPADSNVVPCHEPVVPALTTGRQLDDEEPGRITEEESRPRDDINCSLRQILSNEENSGNLEMTGVSNLSHLSMSQRDMELSDELLNDFFESTCPADEERRSTVPESPISNMLFNYEDQPPDSVDQSITMPVVQDVAHSQDRYDDTATSKLQSCDTRSPLEDMDPDPTVHQSSRADHSFIATETEPVHREPQPTDSSLRPRKTRNSRASQSQWQHSRHSETAVISLYDARPGRRSQRPQVQAGMRRPASPASAGSDDSDDHDYLDSSDEDDGGSNNQPQVRSTKRRKMAEACPV